LPCSALAAASSILYGHFAMRFADLGRQRPEKGPRDPRGRDRLKNQGKNNPLGT